MEKFIKDEINRFKEAEKLWTIVCDTDHPLSKELRESLSIDEITKIALFIKESRDNGIHLLARDKN